MGLMKKYHESGATLPKRLVESVRTTKPTKVVIRGGTIKFVYKDELRSLLKEGNATIRRASHVEPFEGTKWRADLSPVSGPILGPFETRKEALAAEVEWLNKNLFAVE